MNQICDSVAARSDCWASIYMDADLRASLAVLHDGRLGALECIKARPLAEGGRAFHDLNAGRCPAAKIVFNPQKPDSIGIDNSGTGTG